MQVWLHRYTVITCVMTFVLLCAGALVTGTGSGLAVPDWPLSYGQFFPPMVGGILYEHGHRMVAGVVLIMVVGLVVLSHWKEERRAVRLISLISLFLVVAQALLGGMTVVFRLPIAVSISHACLAQTVFSLLTVLALITSPSWVSNGSQTTRRDAEPLPRSLFVHAVIVSGVFFLQLLLGATIRHLKAGLAIPDFPLAFGQLFPSSHFTEVGVVAHFVHRMGALFLIVLVGVLSLRIYRLCERQLDIVGWSGLLLALLITQLMLGAMTIWLRRPIPLTTAHLLVGALCLASSIILSCKLGCSFRRGT